MIPTLATPRLLLRPFAAADARAVAEMGGDPRVASLATGLPHPYPVAEALAWIGDHREAFREGRALTLAITRRGRPIGAVCVHLESRHDRGELGYWLGHRHWGQGYATEAVATVLDWCFDGQRLARVHARHFADNTASARVLEKLGFRREGMLRQHHHHWGRFHDLVLWGLLREEYRPRS